MTRKKVQLAFITNDSARKATYKKRKNGLIKKVNEISTLCGVNACVIIYSPYEAQPVLWPSSDMEVQRVLTEFRGMPELDQSKKMVNQETFLRERIVKIKDQMKKLLKDNREKEMVEVMFQCLLGKDMSHMTIMDYNDLAWLIDGFIRDLNMVLEKFIRASGANAVRATLAGPDIAFDVKPVIHGTNTTIGNPAMTADASLAFEAMQSMAARWFPGGDTSNYRAPSLNINQPYLLQPTQSNMQGGFVFNREVAQSSNNQQLGIFPGVMMPPPLPPQYNMDRPVFNSVVASSSNRPAGLPGVSSGPIMPPSQPPPHYMGGMQPYIPESFDK